MRGDPKFTGGGPGARRSTAEASGTNGHGRDARRPVYHISIVAEMVETHPQTLRMYERMGLIAPRRTSNNVRLYSDDDVEQVRRIQYLTQDLGVNLAGVEVIFNLLREMQRLQEGMDEPVTEIHIDVGLAARLRGRKPDA